ncbi:MAG TPA: saccharopine dehydrogenase C-terminal domain-containing protein, partial [Holophaga sp.]|nr:saccharopine dehydrogenase C-terminal domain-containing protein [Holophaga sp.]
VLGAGRVGAAIALDLAKDTEFNVTVADVSEQALARLRTKGRVATQRRDLASREEVHAAVQTADFVVGAVPGFMGFDTLRTVIEAGKDVVDISFFEEDPLELDALAKARGVTAIMDCGVAPGCDNLILGHAQRVLDRVERFECLVGGLPTIRTWPYEYKAVFSPIDVLEEYTRPARYVARGEVVTMPALSEVELIDFPGVGTLEAFNSDGLRSLLRTVDAPDMKEKTLRYPGHVEKMCVLRETGFFSKDPLTIGDARISPLEVTTRLLFPMWQMEEEDEDFTIMRVTVEGVKDGRTCRFVYDLLDRYDRVTKTTSMARTTGYTCAAAVRMLAAGLFRRKGVFPPELVGREEGCWEFIRENLEERGVFFTEKEG